MWRVQAQLVADIAATYGKTIRLDERTMLFCLFRQSAAQGLRDIVVRMGERVLVRRTSLRIMQRTLRRVGLRVTQRIIGRGIGRMIPLAGALGVAGYAYYDTIHVGRSAADLFSGEIEEESEVGRTAAGPPIDGEGSPAVSIVP
jgi:hypothetical protein